MNIDKSAFYKVRQLALYNSYVKECDLAFKFDIIVQNF